MSNSLDHLPAGKQAELAFVVDVLRTAFGQLERGRYFFLDIVRDGVVLSEARRWIYRRIRVLILPAHDDEDGGQGHSGPASR
jgi:hypothetical protein